MAKDFPEFSMETRVRYGESGPSGQVKLSAVANWFQEAAGLNADELGFGDEKMFACGLTWVLTRMIFRISRMPQVGEQVRVRTWPSLSEHFWNRGYELYDAEDRLLMQSTGAWTVMDIASRRMAPMPEELQAAFPSQTFPTMPFLPSSAPRLRQAEQEAPILVRRDDLDMNGHVNNTRYLGWLMEPLDLKGEALALLDISFRAECFPGDAIASRVSAPEPDPETPALQNRVHALVRTSGEKPLDVCRAVTRWGRA